MNYTIEAIADFCNGEAFIAFPGSSVTKIGIDHRGLFSKGSLFAAIKGTRVDAHNFIPELLDFKGHHFLVTDREVAMRFEGKANFILVPDIIVALQQIATNHRARFNIPVLAIAGSNGKTIVKEWLNFLLEPYMNICRSPKSFNSQIGVPLSVFELNSKNDLAIFEAGISEPREMDRLQQILQPTIGVFTNLGDAHAAHFDSDEQKLHEKWKLFNDCDVVIACADHAWVRMLSPAQRDKCFFWSRAASASALLIQEVDRQEHNLSLRASYADQSWEFKLPFADRASVENAIHCFASLLLLNKTDVHILQRFSQLTPVSMRMEVKQGIEESVLIDDTYNADLMSLRASIDQLKTHVGREKWVVLSDLKEKGDAAETYEKIADLCKDAKVAQVIAIGPELENARSLFNPLPVACYTSADAFWNELDVKLIRNKVILVKGARSFKLENLVNRLQAKQRITTLEIDLQKLGQNLGYFRQRIKPETKVMVMVKAFAYGSGSFEVAHFFQSQRAADYLVVAYADEGTILREKGIHLPIMVMSPSKSSYESMVQNQLEPEIFSLTTLKEFIAAAKGLRHCFDVYPIHLKIDSGMHRLGFEEEELAEALKIISATPFIEVASVFTHLSATDQSEHDGFTSSQIAKFELLYAMVANQLGTQPARHVLNSTGILRFPQYHFEMVRLGIGLYGFSGSSDAKFLHALGALKSYIVQVRDVAAGESVGYARQGVSVKSRRIATVGLGYADGLDRRLGNGNWSISWQGIECPIVGNVCMDMTMIDVSHTHAKEGDEVVVFEGNEAIFSLAEKLNTIPYEILTRIPERVRRVYIQE